MSLLLLCLGALPGDSPKEFYQDFRGGRPLSPGLQFVGPDAAKSIQATASGLHVTFAAGRAKRDPVGVQVRFPIRGDFEITAGYEVVSSEKPDTGHGVGASLVVAVQGSRLENLTVARYLRTGGNEVLAADRGFADKDGRQHHDTHMIPAHKGKRGRLQLKRSGTVVSFLAGEGLGGGLESFHEMGIGAGDVVSARLAGTTGGAATPAEIRLLYLRVRADELPPQFKAKAKGSWPTVVLPLLAASVAILGLAWLWFRRRRDSLS